MMNDDKYNFSDIVKESIDSNDIDVSFIKLNPTLNPLIWDSGDKIKEDVRKILLKNAKRFIEFSGIKNIKFNDIVITGSIANFNYNENSDIDVHIIFDFKQISENVEFLEDFFKVKKTLWATNIPVQVKGYDVEMYFQDSNEKHLSTGVYSLIRNNWVRKPLKKIINVDTVNLKSKASDMINLIDDLIEHSDSGDFISKYDALKNKIKKYRQTGLDTAGEYSTENLVFKVLRNLGYLEKLINVKNEHLQKELSLAETMK